MTEWNLPVGSKVVLVQVRDGRALRKRKVNASETILVRHIGNPVECILGGLLQALLRGSIGLGSLAFLQQDEKRANGHHLVPPVGRGCGGRTLGNGPRADGSEVLVQSQYSRGKSSTMKPSSPEHP